MNDLVIEVTNQIDNGELIIILGDYNEHVRDGELAALLKIINIQEAITKRHYNSVLMPTFQLGKDLIDSIFVSNSIKILVEDYLPFREVISDYRPI